MQPTDDIFTDITPPLHIPHGGTVEEIADKYAFRGKHGPWRQEGNMIICKCLLGTHASPIPTDYILEGTDEDGKPMLRKIEL